MLESSIFRGHIFEGTHIRDFKVLMIYRFMRMQKVFLHFWIAVSAIKWANRSRRVFDMLTKVEEVISLTFNQCIECIL